MWLVQPAAAAAAVIPLAVGQDGTKDALLLGTVKFITLSIHITPGSICSWLVNKIASLGLAAPLLRPSCDLGSTLCFVRLKCNFITILIVSIICHSPDGATDLVCIWRVCIVKMRQLCYLA